MKKKKIYRSVTMVCILCCLLTFLIGDKDGEGGTPQDPGTNSGNSGFRRATVSLGVRIAFVDSNGKKYGQSYDIMNRDPFGEDKISIATYSVSSNVKFLRQQLGISTSPDVPANVIQATVHNNVTFKEVVTGGGNHGVIASEGNELAKLLASKCPGHDATDSRCIKNYYDALDSYLTGGGTYGGKSSEQWFDELLSLLQVEGPNNTYQKLVQNYRNNKNAKGDFSDVIPDSITDRFFQVEPIFALKIYYYDAPTGKRTDKFVVYGTISELALMSSDDVSVLSALLESHVHTASATLCVGHVSGQKTFTIEPSATNTASDLRYTTRGQGVANIWAANTAQKLELQLSTPCDETILGLIYDKYYHQDLQKYHSEIARFANGGDSNGTPYSDVFVINGKPETKQNTAKYSWNLLRQENYMNSSINPDLRAHCRDVTIPQPNTCDEDILDGIYDKYYHVSADKYYEEIDRYRNGGDGRTEWSDTLTIDGVTKTYTNATKLQDEMLKRENYLNSSLNADLRAHCDSTPVGCPPSDPYYPTCVPPTFSYEQRIDDCVNGRSYFRDSSTTMNGKLAWLDYGIAYTKNGVNYSSENTGHVGDTVTSGGASSEQVGNEDYCRVYCYEEVVTNFPTDVYNVKAGQTFQWGVSEGTFGTVQVSKQCSTRAGEYRYSSWKTKYKEVNKKYIEDYAKRVLYTASNAGITVTAGTTSCGTIQKPEGCSGSACTEETLYCDTWEATRPAISTFTFESGWTNKVTVSDPGNREKSCIQGGTCTKEYAKGLASLSTSGITSDATNISSRDNQMVKILECSNSFKYVFNTVIHLVFNEPVNTAYGANSRNFQFDGELLSESALTSYPDGYNTDNVNTSQCTKVSVPVYKCETTGSGASAKPTCKIDYYKTTWNCTGSNRMTWNIRGEWEYKYPTEFFTWYSVKGNVNDDKTLINQKDKDALTGIDDAYFYSIGYGLPTAFSLTNGSYEMKVVVSNLGDMADIPEASDASEAEINYQNQDGHFGPTFDDQNSKGKAGFDYSCAYHVKNEMYGYDCNYTGSTLTSDSPVYCDENDDDDSDGNLNGLDIAYRLVALLSDTDDVTKAFPGRDGTGREVGKNWELPETELHQILDENVYNNSHAQYELMLDVNAIQYIRRSNQAYFSNDVDPYTSYYDETNKLKVLCKSKDNQKYCASEFLTDLQTDSALNYPLMGSCLPNGFDTSGRAQDVLDNGCYTEYNYPAVTWIR